jgi:hypothetical protein
VSPLLVRSLPRSFPWWPQSLTIEWILGGNPPAKRFAQSHPSVSVGVPLGILGLLQQVVLARQVASASSSHRPELFVSPLGCLDI